jgi:hypothetical protein
VDAAGPPVPRFHVHRALHRRSFRGMATLHQTDPGLS